jgi:hypothetical protein
MKIVISNDILVKHESTDIDADECREVLKKRFYICIGRSTPGAYLLHWCCERAMDPALQRSIESLQCTTKAYFCTGCWWLRH